MVFTGYYDLSSSQWTTLSNPSLLETYDERFAAVREKERERERKSNRETVSERERERERERKSNRDSK